MKNKIYILLIIVVVFFIFKDKIFKAINLKPKKAKIADEQAKREIVEAEKAIPIILKQA